MLHRILTWVILLLGVAAPLNAQTIQEPWPAIPQGATSASLGSYLEPLFQSQLGVCINGSPNPVTMKLTRLGGLNTKSLTAVPPQLKDASLQLNGTVLILPDQSVGRAFAYVYPSTIVTVPNPDGGNYINADYLEDPKLLILPGLDWAGYDDSCTSSLAASLKANAGWTFPMAQVASAIQGDISSKSTYHLALVSGTMYSPLWTMYNSPTSQDYKTYARMLIWEWYLRHPGATTDNVSRHLLTQFNGVSVYKVMTNSFSKDGKVDASVTAQFPPVSLSGALQASYNQLSQVSVQSFGVVVRKNGNAEMDVFQPMPLIATIANQLSASARAHLDPKSTDSRLSQQTSHTQVITGIPGPVCTGAWRAEKQNQSLGGTLSVVSTNFVNPKDGSLPSCQFVVQYILDPVTAGTQPPNQVSLDYSLVTEILDNTNAVKASAKIKADTVSLSSSGLPAIQSSTSTGIPVLSATQSGGITFNSFQWSLDFPVTDDSIQTQKIASVQGQPADLTLTCGSRTISPLSGQLSYSNSSSNPALTLSMRHSTNTSIENLDKDALENCTVSGRVTFILNNGTVVPRDLPATTGFYYKAKPAASPSPVPAASPSPVPSPKPPDL